NLSKPVAKAPGEEPGLLARGFADTTTPLEGLLKARTSVSLFRNDEKLEWLGKMFAKDNRFRRDFFHSVRFDFTKTASLSWSLTPREQVDIHDCAEQARGSPEMQKLRDLVQVKSQPQRA